MRFRKLRIAWSVAWGLACVLLIVLWARSYVSSDVLIGSTTANRIVQFTSSWGVLWVAVDSAGANRDWKFDAQPIDGDAEKFVNGLTTHFGFAYLGASPDYAFAFPYWLPVILSFSFATIPWIRWSKRFSLRTLLVATTLIAVGLGLIVYVTQQ